MKQRLNDYTLRAPFSNKDAGFSRWTTAEKEGKVYFIKEFLNPIYPSDDNVSQAIQESMIKECNRFVENRKKIYNEINEASDGNIIRINEFFRVWSHFYIVTENVEDSKYTLEDISKLPKEDKLLLCRCLAHSMRNLESYGIVHGDLKFTNIIFHKTKEGKIVGKIIDFDGAFFEEEPPEVDDDIDCDQVYIAPETLMFICGDDIALSSKIDVFALGIIFHQIFSNELPDFDTTKYGSLAETLLEGDTYNVSSRIPSDIASLINNMLMVDPDKRIKMSDVYTRIGIIMGIEKDSDEGISKAIESKNEKKVDTAISDTSEVPDSEKNTDKLIRKENQKEEKSMDNYFHKPKSL